MGVLCERPRRDGKGEKRQGVKEDVGQWQSGKRVVVSEGLTLDWTVGLSASEIRIGQDERGGKGTCASRALIDQKEERMDEIDMI
jgi:hypothetical protein